MEQNEIKEFKKQCEEYNLFFNRIKTITKDFCLFYKKTNPFEDYNSKDIEYSIEDNLILINWKVETCSCGSWEIETFSIKIPLDFYDNLEEKERLLLEKETIIKNLKKQLSEENNKEYNLSLKIRKLYQDLSSIKELSKRYDLNFNDLDLSKNLKDLEKERTDINENIKFIKKEIANLVEDTDLDEE